MVSTFVDEVVNVPSLTAHTANLIIPLLKKELQPSVVMATLMTESHDGRMTLAVPPSFELLQFVLNITAGQLSEHRAHVHITNRLDPRRPGEVKCFASDVNYQMFSEQDTAVYECSICRTFQWLTFGHFVVLAKGSQPRTSKLL